VKLQLLALFFPIIWKDLRPIHRFVLQHLS